MRKFTIAVIALAVLFLGPLVLSGCQADDGKTVSQTSSSTAPAEEAAAMNLNGAWEADGISAVIGDNSIEINIVGQDSKSLYWKGTFPAIVGNEVTSVGDREALDSSMLGSQDDDKVFTLLDDKIDFDISIAGTTKTIHLKKA